MNQTQATKAASAQGMLAACLSGRQVTPQQRGHWCGARSNSAQPDPLFQRGVPKVFLLFFFLFYIIPGYGRNYLGYEYDLLSSKVTKVKYNEYYKDRFFHQYGYDAENRLTEVQTSTNGKQWDTDARYSYYAHGPLRRIELGEDKLQGIDYTYTLDGKLKAINSPNLFVGQDPSRDGVNDFAADEFAQTLHYHEGNPRHDKIKSTTYFLS